MASLKIFPPKTCKQSLAQKNWKWNDNLVLDSLKIDTIFSIKRFYQFKSFEPNSVFSEAFWFFNFLHEMCLHVNCTCSEAAWQEKLIETLRKNDPPFVFPFTNNLRSKRSTFFTCLSGYVSNKSVFWACHVASDKSLFQPSLLDYGTGQSEKEDIYASTLKKNFWRPTVDLTEEYKNYLAPSSFINC